MKKIGLVLTVIIFFLSLFAIISIRINPSIYGNIWFGGLTIPAFIALNSSVLVVWLFIELRNAFFPFIILLLSYPQIRSTYSLSLTAADTNDVKVMSYNVRSFGPRASSLETLKKVGQLVEDNQPDVLCFQEFKQVSSRRGLRAVRFFKQLGYRNYHFRDYLGRTDSDIVGVMIMSKYPIIDWGDIEGGAGANQTVYIDILHDQKDTLRVYSSHLSSIGLDRHIRLRPQGDSVYTGLLEQLAMGARERGKQLQPILAHMKECRHPFIFAGDLNDVPYSYVYSALRNQAKNSFETAGTGFGFTFNPIDQSDHLQYLRIDNQFYGNGLHCTNHEVYTEVGKLDHFPIIASYHF